MNQASCKQITLPPFRKHLKKKMVEIKVDDFLIKIPEFYLTKEQFKTVFIDRFGLVYITKTSNREEMAILDFMGYPITSEKASALLRAWSFMPVVLDEKKMTTNEKKQPCTYGKNDRVLIGDVFYRERSLNTESDLEYKSNWFSTFKLIEG